MIKGSVIAVRDNSGAKRVKILHMLYKRRNRNARLKLGDVVNGPVKRHKKSRKVKKKDRVIVIIVISKHKMFYLDGVFLMYNLTIGVTLKPNNAPIGTRFKTPVSRHFKKDHLKDK